MQINSQDSYNLVANEIAKIHLVYLTKGIMAISFASRFYES